MNTACNAWIEDKKNTNYTNPGNQPETTTECGSQSFWFYEGKQYSTNNEAEEAKCLKTHEYWRTKGENKMYDAIGGYGMCGETIYVCNESIVDEANYYSTLGCGIPDGNCGGYYAWRLPECKVHEESDFMIRKCGMRPPPHGPKAGVPYGTKGFCSEIGAGKPHSSINGWDSSPECAVWAKCMGYYE